MREISCNAIISSIKEMCIQATHYLSDDMKSALYKGVERKNLRSDVRFWSSCAKI